MSKQVEKTRTSYRDHDKWKMLFYSFSDIIKENAIYSKLPQELIFRNRERKLITYTKDILILPLLLMWSVFFTRFDSIFHRFFYPNISTLKQLFNEEIDYLFVLNTRDHTITALPVLENIEKESKCLVITFKSVYERYKFDFEKLKNTKIIFFEYELRNLSPATYLHIIKESDDKFKYILPKITNKEIRQLIEKDELFVKYHLKCELVQYYFFEKLFNSFEIKGSIAIVFTTAFEICKEKKIPTFILQHGIGGKGHGHPNVSDYWFAYDNRAKEELDEWFEKTVCVLSLGSPRFDYLKQNILLRKNKYMLNKKIGKKEYTKTITYIAGGTKSQLKFQSLKKIRKSLPDSINLIIKEHPRVPLSHLNFQKEMTNILDQKDMEHINIIRNQIDFYDILANTDVLITHHSTGMMEAISVGIPTIQVNFSTQEIPKEYKLSSYGWKEPITDPDTLIKEISLLINNEDYYKYVVEMQKDLQDKIFNNHGHVGKTIAEKIKEICE